MLALLVLSVVVAGLARMAARSDRILAAQLTVAPDTDHLVYAPPTTFLRVVSLGYEHALANVLWFRAISYFGQHYGSDRAYPWLAHMCDRVTDLDPHAEYVYRFAGFILPWEAERVDDGIALLEKGVRNLPDSWDLRYILGFSYYFFKDDLAASSRTLRAAVLTPGAPEFVSQLLAVVDAAQHGPESAIEFLVTMDQAGGSEEMRDAIRKRIRDLTLVRDADILEAAVSRFRDSFQRLPADLPELVSAHLLTTIPPDPFGGRYVLDPSTGQVRSSLGYKPARLGSSKVRAAILKGRAGD